MSSRKVNIMVLGAAIGGFSAVAAGLLAVVDQFTKEPIKAAQQTKTNAALKEVLPPFDNQPADDRITVADGDGGEVVFYRAISGGKLVAVAGESAVKGYSGDVRAMIGLEADGRIRTVIITKQSETPGLGTVVTDRRREKSLGDLLSGKPVESGLPPNRILDQFDGHAALASDPWGAGPWRVKKDGGPVEAVTGATITSRAVARLVNRVARAYAEHRAEIAGIPANGEGE